MIYTIENDKLIAKVSSIGCALVSLIDKQTGIDVVLGYDNEGDYLLNYDAHIGAVVGRSANRIGNGSFSIDDNTYQLSINNGPNNLHSGVGDLSFRAYKLIEHNIDNITFELIDNDMSGGFPGNLILRVTYELVDNSLIFKYLGNCDKKSILNITNHSYFNLSGCKENVLNHELKIYTDKFAINDDDGMATSTINNVDNTSFDFRDYRIINDNLKLNHFNLSNGGLDHNYVFENLDDKKVASLRNDTLELTVTSDLPGMHVYTANYLGEVMGKYSIKYGKFMGVALECQFYPNSINYDAFIKPIINANEDVMHFIKYTIDKR